jgi:hypothetical protein
MVPNLHFYTGLQKLCKGNCELYKKFIDAWNVPVELA